MTDGRSQRPVENYMGKGNSPPPQGFNYAPPVQSLGSNAPISRQTYSQSKFDYTDHNYYDLGGRGSNQGGDHLYNIILSFMS
jgi:hypothetical protein